MIFDFNKNFKSNFQVISNDFIKRSLPRIKNNKKVKLEDIEFNKMFKIYSEIEHDAFYILTPHFMEKIKNIVKKGDAILIKASNAMKFDEITKELLK